MNLIKLIAKLIRKLRRRTEEGDPPFEQNDLRTSDFFFGEPFAHGGTASVSFATPLPGTLASEVIPAEQVAIRTIRRRRFKPPTRENLNREAAIYNAIGEHPNIVKLFARFDELGYSFWVMELLQGGDIFNYMENNDVRFSELNALIILDQVLNAIEHIHQKGIAHRDIKLENIAFVDKVIPGQKLPVVKLIDFGLASYVDPDLGRERRMRREPCGSLGYASPEIVSGRWYVPEESDVWSIGILLFSLISGQFPFEAGSNGTGRRFLRDVGFRLRHNLIFEDDVWAQVSDGVKDIIRKCVRTNGLERPKVADLRMEVQANMRELQNEENGTVAGGAQPTLCDNRLSLD